MIVAGAGTGKTATLVHRVAWLIAGGVDPARILLLTFTRRAAAEMIRRADAALAPFPPRSTRVWGGTFHAMAARLLRVHARDIGMEPDFTILDRAGNPIACYVPRFDLEMSPRSKWQTHTPDYKALIGTSRRTAVPLMELFDAQRLTLRRGNQRRLRAGPDPG